MITYFQALVMGVVQGVTELFPISSLAQAVILPTVLGWDNLTRVQSARGEHRRGDRGLPTCRFGS